MKLPPKKNTPVDKTIITAQSVAGQREAAAERRARYPYHFPVDRRQLGGKFTVKENGRRLLRYFYLERRLSEQVSPIRALKILEKWPLCSTISPMPSSTRVRTFATTASETSPCAK